MVARDADRCGLLIAEYRSDPNATKELASLLSIGKFHSFPMGEPRISLNVQFSVLPRAEAEVPADTVPRARAPLRGMGFICGSVLRGRSLYQTTPDRAA